MRFTNPYLNSGDSVIAKVLPQKSIREGNAELGNCTFLFEGWEINLSAESTQCPIFKNIHMSCFSCIYIHIHIYTVKTVKTLEQFLYLLLFF